MPKISTQNYALKFGGDSPIDLSMEKITITEALSEVNLIKKKIVSKQTKIQNIPTRFENAKDPYESEGGSPKMIQSEMQSINDLGRRLMKIRAGISAANLHHEITLGEDTRSIHDWLVWKREIADEQIKFIQKTHKQMMADVSSAGNQPRVFKDESGTTHLVKIIPNIDYAEWMKLDEKLNEKLEMLDGKLSLKNATITFDL